MVVMARHFTNIYNEIKNYPDILLKKKIKDEDILNRELFEENVEEIEEDRTISTCIKNNV